jgi:hypothetical protein
VIEPEPVTAETGHLEELSRRLEETAARLRADGVEGEAVKRLAGECAELAAQAAVELDRLARGAPHDMTTAAPGQEELL